ADNPYAEKQVCVGKRVRDIARRADNSGRDGVAYGCGNTEPNAENLEEAAAIVCGDGAEVCICGGGVTSKACGCSGSVGCVRQWGVSRGGAMSACVWLRDDAS